MYSLRKSDADIELIFNGAYVLRFCSTTEFQLLLRGRMHYQIPCSYPDSVIFSRFFSLLHQACCTENRQHHY